MIVRIDKECLNKLYIDDNLTVKEIADFLNTTESAINHKLSRFGIKRSKDKSNLALRKYYEKQQYEPFLEIPKGDVYDILRKYKISCDKMKRDYFKYPLRNCENLGYDELYHFYIEQNFSKKMLAEIFNCNETKINADLKYYGIIKDNSSQKMSYQLYNELNDLPIHYTKTEEYKEKMKIMNIEKYGVDNYSKTEEFKKKYKSKMLEKYGVDNYFKIYDTTGRNNRTNKHISDENYNIITSKDKLQMFISKYNTAYDASQQLNISPEYLYSLMIKFNIEHHFQKRFSSYEEVLRELLPNAQYNQKIYGKELDIYFDDKKIGIEFNGNYWHSELHKSMNYHRDKSKYFMDNSIFVYHIFEYEWNDNRKQPIIISQLNNLLGLNQIKIYARKCVIKEVSSKEKREFLELNHMQGNDRCNKIIGLYYQNELVSLMTFSKPKFNKKYEWELSRFCSKMNCNVIGGAAKLFNYFINEYKPTSIISYSDISKTKGLLYDKLGFKHILTTRPNYVWCNNGNILLKSQTRKSKLVGYDSNLSESEIMHSRNYFKIYNCGLKQWVWEK